MIVTVVCLKRNFVELFPMIQTIEAATKHLL